MSVNIEVKKTGTEARIGYMHFFLLRCEVAKIHDEQLGLNGEFADFYAKQRDGIVEGKEWWDKYNEELHYMEHNLPLNPKVLDFLYASDCDAEMTYGCCHVLYDLLKDTEDDTDYGFENSPLTIPIFAQMCKEAWGNKSRLVWY